MAPDMIVVDVPTASPTSPEPVSGLDEVERSTSVERASGLTPCHRFAWGAAGAGVVLFVAAFLGLTGTWALATGAVALTIASFAGVIAMEGCEERVARSSRPGRDPIRTT